jgi:hypothetical protein
MHAKRKAFTGGGCLWRQATRTVKGSSGVWGEKGWHLCLDLGERGGLGAVTRLAEPERCLKPSRLLA